MYSALKRLVVGPPLASSDEHQTRLGRPTALTVFASDAISSTAVRDRRDPPRPRAGRRSGRAQRPRSDLDRRRGPAPDRHHQLPADDSRVPERWRLVRGESREPRRKRIARGRCVLVGRLCTHGGGVGLGGHRRHDVGLPHVAAVPCRTLSSGSVAHHVRQPPRHERVGSLVRTAGVHVHHQPGDPHHLRLVPRLRRQPSGHRTERRGAGRDRPIHGTGFGDDNLPLFASVSVFILLPRVLVRRGRAHRCRGHLERRARLQEARVEERRRARSWPWASSSARSSWASRCWRAA